MVGVIKDDFYELGGGFYVCEVGDLVVFQEVAFAVGADSCGETSTIVKGCDDGVF